MLGELLFSLKEFVVAGGVVDEAVGLEEVVGEGVGGADVDAVFIEVAGHETIEDGEYHLARGVPLLLVEGNAVSVAARDQLVDNLL